MKQLQQFLGGKSRFLEDSTSKPKMNQSSLIIRGSKIPKLFGHLSYSIVPEASSGEESGFENTNPQINTEPSLEEAAELLVDPSTIHIVKDKESIPSSAKCYLLMMFLENWFNAYYLKIFIEELDVFKELGEEPIIEEIRIIKSNVVINNNITNSNKDTTPIAVPVTNALISFSNPKHTELLHSYFNHQMKKTQPTLNQKKIELKVFYAYNITDLKYHNWYGIIIRNLPSKVNTQQLKQYCANQFRTVEEVSYLSKYIKFVHPPVLIKKAFCSLVVLSTLDHAEKLCNELVKKILNNNNSNSNTERRMKACLHPKCCKSRVSNSGNKISFRFNDVVLREKENSYFDNTNSNVNDESVASLIIPVSEISLKEYLELSSDYLYSVLEDELNNSSNKNSKYSNNSNANNINNNINNINNNTSNAINTANDDYKMIKFSNNKIFKEDSNLNNNNDDEKNIKSEKVNDISFINDDKDNEEEIIDTNDNEYSFANLFKVTDDKKNNSKSSGNDSIRKSVIKSNSDSNSKKKDINDNNNDDDKEEDKENKDNSKSGEEIKQIFELIKLNLKQTNVNCNEGDYNNTTSNIGTNLKDTTENNIKVTNNTNDSISKEINKTTINTNTITNNKNAPIAKPKLKKDLSLLETITLNNNNTNTITLLNKQVKTWQVKYPTSDFLKETLLIKFQSKVLMDFDVKMTKEQMRNFLYKMMSNVSAHNYYSSFNNNNNNNGLITNNTSNNFYNNSNINANSNFNYNMSLITNNNSNNNKGYLNSNINTTINNSISNNISNINNPRNTRLDSGTFNNNNNINNNNNRLLMNRNNSANGVSTIPIIPNINNINNLSNLNNSSGISNKNSVNPISNINAGNNSLTKINALGNFNNSSNGNNNISNLALLSRNSVVNNNNNSNNVINKQFYNSNNSTIENMFPNLYKKNNLTSSAINNLANISSINSNLLAYTNWNNNNKTNTNTNASTNTNTNSNTNANTKYNNINLANLNNLSNLSNLSNIPNLNTLINNGNWDMKGFLNSNLSSSITNMNYINNNLKNSNTNNNNASNANNTANTNSTNNNSIDVLRTITQGLKDDITYKNKNYNKNIPTLTNMTNLSNLSNLGNLSNIGNLNKMNNITNMANLSNLSNLNNYNNLKNSNELKLKEELNHNISTSHTNTNNLSNVNNSNNSLYNANNNNNNINKNSKFLGKKRESLDRHESKHDNKHDKYSKHDKQDKYDRKKLENGSTTFNKDRNKESHYNTNVSNISNANNVSEVNAKRDYIKPAYTGKSSRVDFFEEKAREERERSSSRKKK